MLSGHQRVLGTESQSESQSDDIFATIMKIAADNDQATAAKLPGEPAAADGLSDVPNGSSDAPMADGLTTTAAKGPNTIRHWIELVHLPPGSQLWLRLQARNSGGWGAWSEPLELSTPLPTRRPAALPPPFVLGFSESCDEVRFRLPAARTGCGGDAHISLELQVPCLR